LTGTNTVIPRLDPIGAVIAMLNVSHRPLTVIPGLDPKGAKIAMLNVSHRPLTVIPGLDPGINRRAMCCE
jgi:hypothetical protein